jgi:hypothetical protein
MCQTPASSFLIVKLLQGFRQSGDSEIKAFS